jgi:LemA protein
MLEIILGLLGVLIISLIIIFILIYNKFQRLKNGAEAGISQIKVVLKKRLDMISQLVEIVKSYAKFERQVMENIAKIRSSIGEIKTPQDVNKINNESKRILNNLIAVVESYPNLKASENVKDLMNAITDVEDEIARQRYTYNNIVQDYNTRVCSIPSNLVAKMYSFKKIEYLEFEEEVNKRPDTAWNK